MPSVSVLKKVSDLESLIFLFEASLPLHPINSHSGNFVFRGASKHKTISVYSCSLTLCLQTGGDVYLKSCSLASSLSAWNVSHLQLRDMNYLLPNKKRGHLAMTPWWCEGRWENSASHVQLLPLLLGWSVLASPGLSTVEGSVRPASALQCRDPPPPRMQEIGFVVFKLIVLPVICRHPLFRHILEGIHWQCTFKCSARHELQALCSTVVQIFHRPWNQQRRGDINPTFVHYTELPDTARKESSVIIFPLPLATHLQL